MTGKIFINYRRGDDPGHTGRLFDRLQGVFQPEQLFLDVDNIAPGLDFVRVLNERVAECDILLAVIGKGWIDARDPNGKRRLEDPDDFVRIEIELALNQDKRVIPVLVGEAQMPRPDELPEPMRPLARRNAVRLTHERFRADSQGLIKAIERVLEELDARERAEAEARRQAEDQERRRKAEAETRRRAEEERLFAEAKRANTVAAFGAFLADHGGGPFADEAKAIKASLEARQLNTSERQQKDFAETEAREREAKARRQQQAAERERAAEERAFAAIRRAPDLAALDAFIAERHESVFLAEAQQMKAMLLARAEAYRRALASDDRVLLQAFCETYKRGPDVVATRARLRALKPPVKWRPPAIAAAVVAIAIVGAATLAISLKSRSPQTQPVAEEPTAAPAAHAPQTVTATAPATRDIAPAPQAPLPATPPQPAKSPPSPQPDDIAWNLIKDGQNPDQLQKFIDQFPNSARRVDAQQRIAALTAAATAAKTEATIDPHELARALQFELQRVGCFVGNITGDIDDATKAAWGRFTKLASINVPDAASSAALNALRGIDKRVCPLACPKGQHAAGEACIVDAPPALPPPKQAARTSEPAAPVITRPAGGGFGGGGGGGCRNPHWHRLPQGGCGY